MVSGAGSRAARGTRRKAGNAYQGSCASMSAPAANSAQATPIVNPPSAPGACVRDATTCSSNIAPGTGGDGYAAKEVPDGCGHEAGDAGREAQSQASGAHAQPVVAQFEHEPHEQRPEQRNAGACPPHDARRSLRENGRHRPHRCRTGHESEHHRSIARVPGHRVVDQADECRKQDDQHDLARGGERLERKADRQRNHRGVARDDGDPCDAGATEDRADHHRYPERRNAAVYGCLDEGIVEHRGLGGKCKVNSAQGNVFLP